MRKQLEQIEEERKTFVGTFERYGTKSGYMGVQETILLKDIKTTDGEYITDHLWFNKTKGFSDLGTLKFGDIVQFDARSKEYEKGYKGYRDDVYKPIETDYKLSHPSKIKLITI